MAARVGPASAWHSACSEGPQTTIKLVTMARPGTDPFNDDAPDPLSFDDVTLLTLMLTIAVCFVVLIGFGLETATRDILCLWRT